VGVEVIPKVCSPLDPEPGRGDILRLSPFLLFATQIFLPNSYWNKRPIPN
jgi:hypothetical protein